MSDEAIVSIKNTAAPNQISELIEALHLLRNPQNNPSGIVHWSPFTPYKMAEFNGTDTRGICDASLWLQLYLEIESGRRPDLEMATTDVLENVLSAERKNGTVVPIAIAHYIYETPRRTFVAKVISDAQKKLTTAIPEDKDRVLQSGRAFFAAGMLEQRFSDAFEMLPPIHYGSEVTFVVPRSTFATNIPGDPARIEIDFDDGIGYRSVGFDDPIQITYDEFGVYLIHVRVEHGGTELVSTFRFETAMAAPAPDETWPLTAVESYDGRARAGGTAWVYRAKGRAQIEEPLIFADGFGSGATNLNELWKSLNESGVPFADRIRDSGKDLIILGYNDKAGYIQENAFVAVACIEKAISMRRSQKALVTGGASMGGLVTRYALAWMEKQGRDHQTATYLSYDTPHNGAWLPLIVQYFVHYYRNYKSDAKQFSNLVNSAAAQQLLWGHIGSWNQEGPVNQNPMRAKMLNELRSFGWFPSKPKKLGVANGRGDGTGNGVPMGVASVTYSTACYSGELRTMPQFSLTAQLIGKLWVGGYGETSYSATSIQPFDSAPGGTSVFFSQVASALGVTAAYPETCFVPTLSAVSIKPEYTQDLYANISNLPRESSDLNDYTWDSTLNRAHVAVTQELVNWIMARI